jgi:hypothetical protein
MRNVSIRFKDIIIMSSIISLMTILQFIPSSIFSQVNSSNFSSNTEKSEQVLYEEYHKKFDTLLIQSRFEEFSIELKKLSTKCKYCSDEFLIFLSNWADTVVSLTILEIDSNSFVVALENIRILDDLNFNIIEQELKWNFNEKSITDLKCRFNSSLQKKLSGDIEKAYQFYKASSKIGSAGELISNAQFYRLKFFRDVCFDRNTYDSNMKKFVEVSNWIEKSSLDLEYQKIANSQPEWVKMGITYAQYQEWWAQKLSVGSDYMGGGCNNCGKTLYKGKRGGTYYINSSGNKQYVPRQ